MVLAYLLGNGAEAGSHERHPISENNHIRLLFTNLIAHFDPVEWIARVDFATYGKTGRGRVVGELGFAREEETGVLKCESVHLHIVAFFLELQGQTFVESG